MEMEFKDTGRRRRVMLIVIGVALALAAGWGAFMLGSRGTPTENTVKKAVLVASHDIASRTEVTGDDVTVRQVPIDEALPQAYQEAGEVIGRITSVPIYSDQQMTPNLFATSTANSEFSILSADEQVTTDSPYWRAISVKIPAERAVGGAIADGDHVDLIVSVDFQIVIQDAEGNYTNASVASQDGDANGKATKITFQDLEVLKAVPDDELYILKVDLQQSEQIAHVIEVAPDAFTLVLRPAEDTRTADTSQYGTTNDRLTMMYLYPVPQLPDITQLTNPPIVIGTPAPVASTPPPPQPAPTEQPSASPAT